MAETKDSRTSHFWLSMLKSTIRIVGYFTLLVSLYYGVGFLIASEIIGIIEEL